MIITDHYWKRLPHRCVPLPFLFTECFRKKFSKVTNCEKLSFLVICVEDSLQQLRKIPLKGYFFDFSLTEIQWGFRSLFELNVSQKTFSRNSNFVSGSRIEQTANLSIIFLIFWSVNFVKTEILWHLRVIILHFYQKKIHFLHFFPFFHCWQEIAIK